MNILIISLLINILSITICYHDKLNGLRKWTFKFKNPVIKVLVWGLWCPFCQIWRISLIFVAIDYFMWEKSMWIIPSIYKGVDYALNVFLLAGMAEMWSLITQNAYMAVVKRADYEDSIRDEGLVNNHNKSNNNTLFPSEKIENKK